MTINRFDLTDNMHFHFYHYDDPLYRRSWLFERCENAINMHLACRDIAKWAQGCRDRMVKEVYPRFKELSDLMRERMES